MAGEKGHAALHNAAAFEAASGIPGDAAAWLAGLLVGLAIGDRYPEVAGQVFGEIAEGDGRVGAMPTGLVRSIRVQAARIAVAGPDPEPAPARPGLVQ
jgi:hypothetical protein